MRWCLLLHTHARTYAHATHSCVVFSYMILKLMKTVNILLLFVFVGVCHPKTVKTMEAFLYLANCAHLILLYARLLTSWKRCKISHIIYWNWFWILFFFRCCCCWLNGKNNYNSIDNLNHFIVKIYYFVYQSIQYLKKHSLEKKSVLSLQVIVSISSFSKELHYRLKRWNICYCFIFFCILSTNLRRQLSANL